LATSESGFTLLEVAIVLMIIGLLVGGVIKGQELVNTAKTRSLAQDFVAVKTALYGYQGRFKALPGDRLAASTSDPRANVATTPAGMLGNGRIDGAWDSISDTDESRLFWQHARLAGFLAGSFAPGDLDYAPTTHFGTNLGISSTMQLTGPTTQSGTYNVCAGGIPGRFAKQLDMQIDDGNTLTGAVRAASETSPHAALATSAIDDGEKYLVCYAF
jgi:prepilin-type N-terminal cleavage/methylation domain-containing protein